MLLELEGGRLFAFEKGIIHYNLNLHLSLSRSPCALDQNFPNCFRRRSFSIAVLLCPLLLLRLHHAGR